MYIIAGKHKKRRLEVPKSQHVRPTSSQLREAVFNICQRNIEGANFLDLFAGSGAMGLEALSRGALHATLIEKDRFAFSCIKKNIEYLQEEAHTTALKMDVLEGLSRLSQRGLQFDLIYADPPYEVGFGRKVLDFIDKHPLLAEEGTLFIEDASFEEPTLDTLILISRRKLGRATLYEYRFNSRDI